MALIQISKKVTDETSFALFDIGFRIFFLGAGIFSAFTMFLWMSVFSFHFTLATMPFTPFQWHAHEMIYGYSMAVIAGFLLTAVSNWTGQRTLYGMKLMFLFLSWLSARIFFIFGEDCLIYAGIFDSLFGICLLISVFLPIYHVKQWKQLALLSKILILNLGNIAFYLVAFGVISNEISLALYAGFYTIISLILTIGGRVVPTFIEIGVDENVKITNPISLTIVSLLVFVVFFINELFFQKSNILICSTFILFILNIIRLYCWHAPGIWKKPLLWGLYLSYCSIAGGFLLLGLSPLIGISKYLAIHTFAVGGIGFATLAMMTRVSLGHSGRNIHKPPLSLKYYLMLLALALIFRVILPLFDSVHYQSYVMISQVFWILSFLTFILSFQKMGTATFTNRKGDRPHF